MRFIIVFFLLTSVVYAQKPASPATDIVWQGTPDNCTNQVVITQNADMGYTLMFDNQVYNFPFTSKVHAPVRVIRNAKNEITDYYTHFEFQGNTLIILIKDQGTRFYIKEWEFQCRKGIYKS